MFKRAFFFFVFTVCVSACDQELSKKGQGENKTQIKALSAESIAYTVTPTEEPNRYSIKFSWASDITTFKMQSPVSKDFVATSVDSGFSEVVEGGREYEYKFSSSEPSQPVIIKVAVPKDIVLSGQLNYSGKVVLRANRLFITRGALVSSYRNDIDIRANEIYADGGTIQNYPTGYMDCLPRTPEAFAGGNISIIAKKAYGKLTLILSGARGCNWGVKGGSGGKLILQVEDGTALHADVQLLRSQGGPYKQSFMPAGAPGETGTACVSLEKGSGDDCL
ncbi:hypothetical protein [Bdellovibrio sp. HCB-162]|uniref:hypothetical protein n=1 Tax=Bdellovibrio sp. HCB-162 TaxID=3394234 RepID=UPI0039BD2A7A